MAHPVLCIKRTAHFENNHFNITQKALQATYGNLRYISENGQAMQLELSKCNSSYCTC